MTEQALNYRPIIQQLIRNGDESSLKEALELACQWMIEEAQNPMALLHAGDLYRRLQQSSLAVESYRNAATLYSAQGKMVQAIATLKLTLELEPDNAEVKEQLASLFPQQTKVSASTSEKTPKAAPIATPSISKGPPTPGKTALPPVPLFSTLPPQALQKLVPRLERQSLADGDFVCREGDPGDSIFVLSQGRVAVRIFNSDGTFRDLTTLEEGSFFGEFAYFSGQKRQASVQALGPGEVLILKRAVLDQLIKDFPQVQMVLEDFYQERLLDSLVARSDLFRTLERDDRQKIIEKFTVTQVPDKTTVLLEGDPGDTFYFIQSGDVEVFRDRGGKKVILARLSAGDFFGELALLNNHRRTASVRTLSACQFLTLKREQVETILANYPNVAETLQKIAQQRLATTKPSKSAT